MNSAAMTTIEQVRPTPVRVADNRIGRLLFSLRLIGDLQLKTIWQFLVPQFRTMTGDLLDVGCGEMPFRAFLPDTVRYTGIDVPQAAAFSMAGGADVREFDGRTIPFPDASFDYVLCTEVLEHAEAPEMLVAEMHRVLRPGGTLLATIPFSARVHYAPYDFQRFTRFGLQHLFAAFEQPRIDERGNDIAVIANKLIVLCARLARPSRWLPLTLLGALIVGVVASLFLCLAHLSMMLGRGSKDDPLGYAVVANRSRA
jgi:SAM-dependent methyltransferase